ncbi:MAG TPA: hypothetical protein VHY91_03395 [Pirellulales bacterium]|jgi:hypothetical protein|nr:hypothetical protein [Pirellulales bacterium]
MFRRISLQSTSLAATSGLWRSLLVAALLVAGDRIAAAAQTAAALCAPALVRPQDDLWLVSQRGLGCSPAGVLPSALHYWHYVPGAGWQKATSADFFASDDPGTLTQIWIHGNQIEHSRAFGVGWTVYTSLARRATSEQPLRFVIWSWPSDKVGGPLEDVRVKAGYTLPAAFHLARFIDAIQSDVHVGLTAYSFGGRIVEGALQLLAGGALNGRTIALNSAARPLMDVVLIAAAADSDWLLPRHARGQALKVVNRMLLVRNSCDKVLRFYHWLYGRGSCAEAVGYIGMGGLAQLGAGQGRIAQFDACCLVGAEHYWANYFASPAVVGRLLPYVFPAPPATAGATNTAPPSAAQASALPALAGE